MEGYKDEAEDVPSDPETAKQKTGTRTEYAIPVPNVAWTDRLK